MKATASFQTNHKKLEPGLYVYKREVVGNQSITTFDLRFGCSDGDASITQEVIEAIEDIGTLYLKKISPRREDVIYFGTVRSDARFTLIMRGLLSSEDIADTVTKMCDFILMNGGQILENNKYKRESYSEREIDDVKLCVIEYSDMLRNNPCYEYPA